MDAMLATQANMTALQAYETGNIGISFAGAGFLVIYYLGVIKIFEQLGITNPASPPPVGGSSSGAITAGAVCSGIPETELHKLVNALFDSCRQKPCAGHLDATVREVLEKYLPPNAAERCRGKIVTSVTVLEGSRPRERLASAVGGDVSDRADLISTLAASAYIPMFSGRSMFVSWRGKETADGSLFTPQQPCPPGVGYCIKMTVLPADAPRPTLPQNLMGIARALGNAEPAAAKTPKPQLPERPPKGGAAPEMAKAVQARGLDIAPGLALGSRGMDAAAWNELVFTPCDPETCDYIYKMGQLDAMAWAEATGIAAAAAPKKQAAARAAAAPATAPAGAGVSSKISAGRRML